MNLLINDSIEYYILERIAAYFHKIYSIFFHLPS